MHLSIYLLPVCAIRWPHIIHRRSAVPHLVSGRQRGMSMGPPHARGFCAAGGLRPRGLCGCGWLGLSAAAVAVGGFDCLRMSVYVCDCLLLWLSVSVIAGLFAASFCPGWKWCALLDTFVIR